MPEDIPEGGYLMALGRSIDDSEPGPTKSINDGSISSYLVPLWMVGTMMLLRMASGIIFTSGM